MPDESLYIGADGNPYITVFSEPNESPLTWTTVGEAGNTSAQAQSYMNARQNLFGPYGLNDNVTFNPAQYTEHPEVANGVYDVHFAGSVFKFELRTITSSTRSLSFPRALRYWDDQSQTWITFGSLNSGGERYLWNRIRQQDPMPSWVQPGLAFLGGYFEDTGRRGGYPNYNHIRSTAPAFYTYDRSGVLTAQLSRPGCRQCNTAITVRNVMLRAGLCSTHQDDAVEEEDDGRPAIDHEVVNSPRRRPVRAARSRIVMSEITPTEIR